MSERELAVERALRHDDLVAEFVRFGDDMGLNRQALAQGVEGRACTYVGPFIAPLYEWLAYQVMPKGWELRSVEQYEGEAANVYVGLPDVNPAKGFVRIRVVEEGQDG